MKYVSRSGVEITAHKILYWHPDRPDEISLEMCQGDYCYASWRQVTDLIIEPLFEAHNLVGSLEGYYLVKDLKTLTYSIWTQRSFRNSFRRD